MRVVGGLMRTICRMDTEAKEVIDHVRAIEFAGSA